MDSGHCFGRKFEKRPHFGIDRIKLGILKSGLVTLLHANRLDGNRFPVNGVPIKNAKSLR